MKILGMARLICLIVGILSATWLGASKGLYTIPGVSFASSTISNATSTLATPVTRPVKRRPVIRPHFEAVSNYPRTVIMGSTERFSVRSVGLNNAPLIYLLRYPNGKTIQAYVQADARGYSSYTFRMNPGDFKMRSHRVKGVTIEVETQDLLHHVILPFAINRPG